MILNGPQADNISAAESTRRSWEEEDNRQARQHDLAVRTLELEIMKVDAKWSAWFKIPLTILKLPVYIIMAIGYCVAVARRVEVGEEFWRLLK